MNDHNDLPGDFVTTEEFISLIVKQSVKEQDLFAYGRSAGWLEEQDESSAKKKVERRQAARIVHEFLRRECREKDEADWSAARKLKDLFDCRACVNHVAQVYVKGIMGARDQVFYMTGGIERAEAEEIGKRIFDIRRRMVPGEEKPSETGLTNLQDLPAAKAVLADEVPELIKAKAPVLLIDVRSRYEYEEQHMENAVHIPMAAILNNPHIVGADQEHPLLLYCDRGYRSEVAANCLAQVGYRNVYYIDIREDGKVPWQKPGHH